MPTVDAILAQMKTAPAAVRFSELSKVCTHFFGPPRQAGTSHQVYRTPWAGDPRVNIQNAGGKAKAYQVRQVLKAITQIQQTNAP